MKRFFPAFLIGILFFSFVSIFAQQNNRKGVVQAQKKERKLLNAPLKGEQTNSPDYVSPLIRIEPDSLSYTLPRFVWSSKDFYIYNDGDQPLTVSITDVETTALSPSSTVQKRPASGFFVPLIKQQLRKIHLPAGLSISETPVSSAVSGTTEAVVITDPGGDVPNPGLDVVSVEISENLFSYIFKINFAGVPDSSALPILSLDLDQNFGSGAFPSPLGFGPGFFDVGAEYDIVFDVGNFLGDSLGLPPSAYAIEGGDSSFTPVSIALLSIGSSSVEAQFLKIVSLVDENLNAALVSLSVGPEIPDFAPDYGHGLLGQENGLSWLTELDSSGFSSIPLEGTVAPGDSMRVQAKLVSVNPEGNYSAEIQISNNSANNPGLVVPVAVSIMGLANPVIEVTPAQISDTLSENQVPKSYDLTISNIGEGTLAFLVTDSLPAGEDWLSVPPLTLGQLGGGESEVITVEVDPAGLAVNQSYLGYVVVTSNDTLNPQLLIPVEIYIQGSLGIDSEEVMPKSFMVYPNFPNPFNPSTQIKFDLPKSATVRLEIYNALGQRVKVLLDRQLSAGQYQVDWHGINDAGEQVASGIYIYRLQAGDQTFARKMILMR